MFDIIIVGGGLVGSGLALALKPLGLKIALIDAKTPSFDDHRLFALNISSCHFLQNLNLWEALQADACAIHQVHVSKRGAYGSVRLKRDDVNVDALGYVIPAGVIERAMHQHLNDICVYQPAKLTEIDPQNHQVTIETTEGKKTLAAPLIIGADGTHSTVRKLLSIETELHNYQQTAIVTITQLRRSHDHCAYERFVEKGAIALLPLPDNRCATIWTTDNEEAKVLLSISDSEFLEKLQSSFGTRLGRFVSTSQRFSYPLVRLEAKEAVRGPVMLLGNAHHTLHPIAAQGLNLALYEVASLVEEIDKKGKDLNSYHLNLDQKNLSKTISHRLTNFFADSSLIKDLGFQLGMIGLEVAAPVKRRFITKLLGRAGMVPRLMLSSKNL